MKVSCVQGVICDTQMIHNAAMQTVVQHNKYSDAWPKINTGRQTWNQKDTQKQVNFYGKHMNTHKNTPALLQESPSWKCCQSILLWDVTECFSGFCLCHMPVGTNVSTRVVAVCLYPQESLACFMLLSWLRTKTPDMSWPDSILVTWTSGIPENTTLWWAKKYIYASQILCNIDRIWGVI